MDHYPYEPHFVAAHVERVAERTASEAERLVEVLFASSWPTGSEDRLDPIAVEWVRRWAPSTLAAAQLGCSCPDGRCLVCN